MHVYVHDKEKIKSNIIKSDTNWQHSNIYRPKIHDVDVY